MTNRWRPLTLAAWRSHRIGLGLLVGVALTLGCGGVAPVALSGQAAAFATPVASPVTPPEQASAQPFATQSAPADAPLIPAAPVRDLFDLYRRVRGVAVAPTTRPRPEPALGDRQQFWITDPRTYVHYRTEAALVYLTPEAAYWVEKGASVGQLEIEAAARGFEGRVLPAIRRFFGDFAIPGIDGDPRLHILHARLNGVAGYYSVSDEYPVQLDPHSNEREMVLLNVGVVRPGTEQYLATLSHELVHAVYWNLHRSEDSWVNEGAAELGSKLAGLPTSFQLSFARRPNTQLNTWPDGIEHTAPHYGASFLFLDYLFANYGGFDSVPRFVAQPADGLDGVDGYLAAIGSPDRSEEVFRDWTVANLVGRTSTPYAYETELIRLEPERSLLAAPSVSGEVQQFAARYFQLPKAEVEQSISFRGQPSTALLSTTPTSGHGLWWSNQGDSIDSRLTRTVDLTGVQQATLHFNAWYDIEADWDHAYVMVSTDSGRSWQPLAGRQTTEEDPHGTALGSSYTGTSGGGAEPAWTPETVDLSRFAGQRILLRFEYVTDEGTNNAGLAIDDLAIPEIDWLDDAEGDGDWTTDGFVRIDRPLLQRYFVQVVERSDPPAVTPLVIQPDGSAKLTLPASPDGVERVLVVAAATRYTRQAAPFTVELR